MFLGAECDVVDHHEIEERVYELGAVGTVRVSEKEKFIFTSHMRAYMANDIISLPSLSGAMVWIGMDLLNPPQPPESSSIRPVAPSTQMSSLLLGFSLQYVLSVSRSKPILSRLVQVLASDKLLLHNC